MSSTTSLDTETSSNRRKKDGRKSHGKSSEIQSIASASPPPSENLFAARRKNQPRLPPVAKPRRPKKQPSADITSDDLSEITNSDIHESMQTSKSDQHSYRDMLRDRFRSVKRQSKKSLLVARPKSGENDRFTLNRCVELAKRKSVEIDKQLEGYRKPRVVEELVSNAEKYHFFCESVAGRSLDGDSDVAEAEDVEKGDVGSVVNSRAALIISQVIDAENELFWNSSRAPSQPLDTNSHLRNLSEEGLYTPDPPTIPTSHLKTLRQRLLSTDNSGWFDPAGGVTFSENPLSKTNYRPENYAAGNPVESEYIRASMELPLKLDSVLIEDNYLLEIYVQSAKFKHHHLFSLEHVLQEKLIDCYDAHRKFTVSNGRERLERRLETLRRTKSDEEIKTTREQLFAENRAFRENVKNLMGTWKTIKKLRQDNKYANTAIKLEIRKAESDFENDKERHEKLFEETLREIMREQGDGEIKPAKIKKPEIVKSNLRATFAECFRAPGEPELHFTITYDNEVTKVVEDSKEISRRNGVANTKMFLKFFCDDREICKSKPKKLSDDFLCLFDESFCLKLTDVPKHVRLQLWEQTGALNRRKVCQIDVPVPKKNVSNQKVHEEHFTNEVAINCNHNGVGSGVKINEAVLSTGGYISAIIQWNQLDTCERNEEALYNNILDANGCIDLNKLNAWIQNAQLDPQDPKNAVIFDYLNNQAKPDPGATNKYFRCDPYMHTFVLCDRKELEENARFKLLELRDRNEPEFAGMVVPNRLKEIPTNIFSAYERRLAEENLEEYFQEDDYENEINSRRSYGRKYLRQIHTKIFQMCRNAQNNLSFEDVVNEQTVAMIETYIKTSFESFLNWFRFRPKLSAPTPVKKLHEKEGLQLIENSSASKIVIRLIDGLNIPARKSGNGRKRRSTTSNDSNSTEVKPFVEIAYHNVKVRTATAGGESPAWNEEIRLPLETANTDYLSPAALNGSITLNLFDEYTEETYNWLGSIQIPVSAICQTKLEGMFLVQTPTSLMCYEQVHETRGSASSKSSIPPQSHSNYTYLNLRIGVEPTIPKLSPDMSALVCSEPPFLRDHILEWNSRFNLDHPKRKFSALAIDSNGKTVCITRYIKPLEPPQINADGFDVTANQCARYLSLIPFTDCNNFYQNMWLSTEQLLKLGLGSTIDHAVALTCYFLSLKLEVWLLLGSGIPHGVTGYVLVREYVPESPVPLHFVYDVVTGYKYNMTDIYCPLQKIYCVVNDTNVWGNIQRGDTVATTRFDFSRRFDWSALYNNQIGSPTNSIQQKLLYISNYDVHPLQTAIERKLRKTISKMRVHDRTVWNHYLSAALKKAMAKYEVNSMHGKSHMDVIPELQEFSQTCEVNGCVINIPFSRITSIVEKIFYMKFLHTNNVEFATGVWVCPYPNQIISVWVALASISKR